MEPQKTALGMEEHVETIIMYVASLFIGFISPLVFFLIDSKNNFVKFHSLQYLLVSAVVFVLVMVFVCGFFVAAMIAGPLALLMYPLIGLLSLGMLILFVICIIKAANKQYFKLPVVGGLAEKWSGVSASGGASPAPEAPKQ